MQYREKSLIRSSAQSGNVFFALFGAVALVGVLGAATMTIMRGPVTGMQKVTKYTIAENAMIAAGRLAIVTSGEDCDEDSVMEPLEWDDPGTAPAPTGGGHLPTTIGAARQDPWGNIYGYCVWDHGAEVDNAGCGGPTQNRLAGDSNIETEAGGIVIAVISSGPDRIFQTTCEDHPDYVTKGGDDVALFYTYGEAKTLAAGLWKAKGDEGAEIARDLEVYSSANPTQQIFGLDSQSDPTKPSIKVDFISKLSPAALGVTFLSNLLVDGGRIGIGTNDPISPLQISASSATITLQDTNATLGANGQHAAIMLRDQNLDIIGYMGFVTAKQEMVFQNKNATAPLSLWTNDQRRLTIKADGNTGIGTADPQAKLDITAAGEGAPILRFNTDRAWRFEQSGAGGTAALDLRAEVGGKRFNIKASDGTQAASFLASTGAHRVNLVPEGGRVGIGNVAAPLSILHIRQESDNDGDGIRINNSANTDTFNIRVASNARTHIGGGASPSAMVLKHTTGGVGIGTDDPSNPLHVRTSGPTTATFERTATNNTGIEYKNSTASMYAGLAGNAIGWGISGSADIGANPSFIVRRDTGNVGIGTSAPAYKTEISGTLGVLGGAVRFDRGGNYDIWLQGGSASSGEARNLALLGQTTNDRLYVNYGSEYTGGTIIGGPVSVSGDLNVSGNITGGGLGDNLGNHTATQALNMGSKKITNLATPTANADGATKLYVDQRAALAADNLGSGGTTTGTLYSNGGTYGYLGLDGSNMFRFNDGRAYLRLGGAYEYDFAPSFFRPYSNGTIHLGTSANRWNNIYGAGDMYIKSITVQGGTIAMGGNKITGLGAPTVSTDAATKAYVDANSGGGSYSHGDEGYQWIGATLLQWGTRCQGAQPPGAMTQYSFPTAFPNAVYNIVGSASSSHNGGATRARFTISIVSQTQYSIGLPDSTGACVSWQAIGR